MKAFEVVVLSRTERTTAGGAARPNVSQWESHGSTARVLRPQPSRKKPSRQQGGGGAGAEDQGGKEQADREQHLAGGSRSSREGEVFFYSPLSS